VSSRRRRRRGPGAVAVAGGPGGVEMRLRSEFRELKDCESLLDGFGCCGCEYGVVGWWNPGGTATGWLIYKINKVSLGEKM
jgi:hypothetical protein